MTRLRSRPVLLIAPALAALFMLGAGCRAPAVAVRERPATWAQPITVAGVPNLHRVTPDLYRSAQPTRNGMRALERMGIKTVVNLRSFHSDDDEVEGTELANKHVHVQTWDPTRQEVIRFLRYATDTNRQPVLVHCLHGADRTGTMCAFYRVAVQGWSKDDAIEEMTGGGYNYHPMFDNLISFIRDMDIEALRRDAGIGDAR